MRIRWTEQANRHLNQAFSYIVEQDKHAALKVINKVEAIVTMLSSHPKMGRKGRVKNTRELVIAGTPYIVVYRTDAEHISIIAVIHASQRWPRSFH